LIVPFRPEPEIPRTIFSRASPPKQIEIAIADRTVNRTRNTFTAMASTILAGKSGDQLTRSISRHRPAFDVPRQRLFIADDLARGLGPPLRRG
jgi:hypothetical protein